MSKKEKSLIINLSYNPDDIKEYLSSLKTPVSSLKVIDITGTCKSLNNNGFELIIAREIDVGNKIELDSLNDLVDFVGTISRYELFKNKDIRSLQIERFPVFWLTDIAGKLNDFHWGQSFLFLNKLISCKPELFNNHKSYTVVLPVNCKGLKYPLVKIFISSALKAPVFPRSLKY